MGKNRTLLEIIKVSLSNFCLVFSGVFVGFLIPKVLGTTEYGYYKIFTLYATYVGLFSFGISEGLYLKYSGKSFDELNFNRIRFYTKLIFGVEIFVSFLIVLFSAICLSAEYRWIFIALSIYMFELNITVYYQFVAQMTMRMNDYSARNVIKSVLTIIAALLMFVLYYQSGRQELSYKIYIVFVLVISTILMLMYIRKFKIITFGSADNYWACRDELREMIKMGIPFLIASLCSTLILNIDKQFVSMFFDTATYGLYAFAYNMLALVTVCTSAISTVLYPTMKRAKDSDLGTMYPKFLSYVLCFIFFALISYYPLKYVVSFLLPQYEEALVILRIVFPGLAYSAAISVVMQNFYKLVNRNDLFFYINVVVLGITVFTNAIAYFYFKTPESISIASVLTLIVYYKIAERFFVRNYHVKWRKNFLYAIVMTIVFYVVTQINYDFMSCVIYVLALCVLTMLFYGKMFAELLLSWLKKE